MPRKRAQIGRTLPSGQTLPRDKIGDKPGFYPEPSDAARRPRYSDLVSPYLRHGKQGLTVINWDAFGAKGSKGKVRRDKRPMRLQNSPVPHTKVVNGRFDPRSGKWTHTTPKPVACEEKPLSQLWREAERSSKPIKPYKRKATKGNV